MNEMDYMDDIDYMDEMDYGQFRLMLSIPSI